MNSKIKAMLTNTGIIKVFKKLKTSNIYHIVFIYIYNIIENKMEPTSLSESEFDEEISHSGDCAKRKPSESIDEYECIFEPMIDGIDVLIFDETKKRELNGLVEACTELKLKKGLILTEDFSGEEKIGKITIVYEPLWKWLLKNE